MAEVFDVDDLSDAIETLATGSYVVTRPGPSSVDAHGRRVAPTVSIFEALGVVHPVRGAELERLPEALRSREVMVFVTTVELRTSVAGEPDVVTVDGRQWEVATQERWDHSGNFWRCIIARRGG